jgi:hypothetical protein
VLGKVLTAWCLMLMLGSSFNSFKEPFPKNNEPAPHIQLSGSRFLHRELRFRSQQAAGFELGNVEVPIGGSAILQMGFKFCSR